MASQKSTRSARSPGASEQQKAQAVATTLQGGNPWLSSAPRWSIQEAERLIANPVLDGEPNRPLNPAKHRLLTDPRLEKVWANLRHRLQGRPDDEVECTLQLLLDDIVQTVEVERRPINREALRLQFEHVAQAAQALAEAMQEVGWRPKKLARTEAVWDIRTLAQARALASSSKDLDIFAAEARATLERAPRAADSEIHAWRVAEEAIEEWKADPRFWPRAVKRPGSDGRFQRQLLIQTLSARFEEDFQERMPTNLAVIASVALDREVSVEQVKGSFRKRGNKTP